MKGQFDMFQFTITIVARYIIPKNAKESNEKVGDDKNETDEEIHLEDSGFDRERELFLDVIKNGYDDDKKSQDDNDSGRDRSTTGRQTEA